MGPVAQACLLSTLGLVAQVLFAFCNGSSCTGGVVFYSGSSGTGLSALFNGSSCSGVSALCNGSSCSGVSALCNGSSCSGLSALYNGSSCSGLSALCNGSSSTGSSCGIGLVAHELTLSLLSVRVAGAAVQFFPRQVSRRGRPNQKHPVLQMCSS